jgi:hypothetical protein
VALDPVEATCVIPAGAVGASVSAHGLDEATTVAAVERIPSHVTAATPSV